MGLGWFDAIAPVVSSLGSGFNQGRLQAAETQRKMQQEALQRALLQAQIDHYKAQDAAPQEWQPTTFEEAKEYELSIHPERLEKPAGTQQSEWAKAGFPDTPQGRQDYLDWIGQKSKAEYPERFRDPPRTPASTRVVEDNEAEGLGYLGMYEHGRDMGSARGVQQAQAFHDAYKAIRAQNQDMTPGRVARQAYRSASQARPDIFGKPPKENDILGDLGLDAEEYGGTEATAPTPAVPAVPTPRAPAPPTPENPTAQRRVVTQDQADYLRATNQWDDNLYEVR